MKIGSNNSGTGYLKFTQIKLNLGDKELKPAGTTTTESGKDEVELTGAGKEGIFTYQLPVDFRTGNLDVHEAGHAVMETVGRMEVPDSASDKTLLSNTRTGIMGLQISEEISPSQDMEFLYFAGNCSEKDILASLKYLNLSPAPDGQIKSAKEKEKTPGNFLLVQDKSGESFTLKATANGVAFAMIPEDNAGIQKEKPDYFTATVEGISDGINETAGMFGGGAAGVIGGLNATGLLLRGLDAAGMAMSGTAGAVTLLLLAGAGGIGGLIAGKKLAPKISNLAGKMGSWIGKEIGMSENEGRTMGKAALALGAASQTSLFGINGVALAGSAMFIGGTIAENRHKNK